MAEGVEESSSVANKVFTFKDDGENSKECVSVTIPEVLDPQFGMYVWPCAVVLAQFLWKNRQQLKNKTLLEVGAGVALPGVLAARLGAVVLLSDAADLPLCLRNCARSCEANGLQDVPVLGLSWGHVSPRLLSLPHLDVILGSDVFYDPQDFESVLVTVAFLFKRNPHAQFWTTYQVRSSDWSLEPLLARWSMCCELVPLEAFEADKPELAGSRLPGNHSVQMLIVTPGDGRRRSPWQRNEGGAT